MKDPSAAHACSWYGKAAEHGALGAGWHRPFVLWSDDLMKMRKVFFYI
jgi:hypothetical protein